MSDSKKYPVLMRLIHWFMAICILGMIGTGWYMAGLDAEASNKYDLYPWHKSFGVLMLITIVIRTIVRLVSLIPELPATMPAYEKKLAGLTHFLLYLMMFVVPTSGYLMSATGGRDVFMFQLKMPDLPDNQALASFMYNVHGYAPYILLGIIVLHILGALKHRIMDDDKNDVLKRMM